MAQADICFTSARFMLRIMRKHFPCSIAFEEATAPISGKIFKLHELFQLNFLQILLCDCCYKRHKRCYKRWHRWRAEICQNVRKWNITSCKRVLSVERTNTISIDDTHHHRFALWNQPNLILGCEGRALHWIRELLEILDVRPSTRKRWVQLYVPNGVVVRPLYFLGEWIRFISTRRFANISLLFGIQIKQWIVLSCSQSIYRRIQLNSTPKSAIFWWDTREWTWNRRHFGVPTPSD